MSRQPKFSSSLSFADYLSMFQEGYFVLLLFILTSSLKTPCGWIDKNRKESHLYNVNRVTLYVVCWSLKES
jgi:hypothetical protein